MTRHKEFGQAFGIGRSAFLSSVVAACLLIAAATASANTVTIDTATKYQTIDGFGWHGAMHLYWNSGPYYSPAWLALVVDTLGLTLERNTYDSPSEFATEQKDMLINMNAKAKASHEPIQFWFAVWSPPANMKSSGSTNGGSLIASQYHNYGNWVVAGMQAYQTAGIPLYGFSPQNEPSVNQTDHATCAYTPPETFIAMFDTIAPIIKAAFPTVKFIASENCCLDFNTSGFNAGFIADATSKQYLNIFAYHDYQGTAGWATGVYPVVKSHLNGTTDRLWETESGYQGDDMNTTMNAAMEIHNNLTLAQANAYLWWQGTGDDDLTNFSVIDVKMNIGHRFWMLRQFYRFIRPGAVRMKATLATGDANLLVTAFKRKTVTGADNWAVVAVNKATTTKVIKLAGTALPGPFDVYQTSATTNGTKVATLANADSITVPGQSISTFVFGDYHGGIDISTGNFVGVRDENGRASSENVGTMPLRLSRTADGIAVGYDVGRSAAVRITLVAIDGRVISTLVDRSNVTPGSYSAELKNNANLGRGMYLIRATIGDRSYSLPDVFTK